MGRHQLSLPRALTRLLALLVLSGLVLGACAPAAPTAPGQSSAGGAAKAAGPSGTLTIAQLALLPRADPYAVTANAEHSIVYSVWDPLSRVDEEGNTKMYLAESWENESPTSWIVKLRTAFVRKVGPHAERRRRELAVGAGERRRRGP
jgi:ABC-type transport system substrate-binding protein